MTKTMIGDDRQGDLERERRTTMGHGVQFPDAKRAPAVDTGRGVSWEEDIAELSCSTTVSDLGLIKIKGLWMGREMPEVASQIVEGFMGILSRIDPSVMLIPEDAV